jgi:hypothetical protein
MTPACMICLGSTGQPEGVAGCIAAINRLA